MQNAVFFERADFVEYRAGAIEAGIVGCLAAAWMIRIVSDRRVHSFAIHCALFGLALLVFFGGRSV